MNKYKNKIPLIMGILFFSVAVTAVAYAWLSGIYLYDLRLSFSSYVGLHHSTSMLYFAFALVMIPTIAFYLTKRELLPAKKAIYAVISVFVLGTALFPCNRYSSSPSELTTKIHTFFSMGGILPVTVSFILSAIFPKSKKQRFAAFASLLYAAVFVVLFVTGFPPLFQTFFIWENLFIVLLLLELHTEQYEETEKSK